MLDLLWENDRRDIVAFTYGWKICDLLQNKGTYNRQAAVKNMEHVLALVKEAQQFFGVDLGTYFEWGISLDADGLQFYDRERKVQNGCGVRF